MTFHHRDPGAESTGNASRAPQPARPPGRLRDTAPGVLILLGIALLLGSASIGRHR